MFVCIRDGALSRCLRPLQCHAVGPSVHSRRGHVLLRELCREHFGDAELALQRLLLLLFISGKGTEGGSVL